MIPSTFRDTANSPAHGETGRRVLALAEQLIACPSVTPVDGGCQAVVAERLGRLGFECHRLVFGAVTNLWAIRGGSAPGPVVVFAGHTDVVPPGPMDAWTSDPFEPTHRDGRLYGRGASDMKSSVAAMVVAAEDFLAANSDHRGAVAMLLTSDEEGPATHGTAKVCEWLRERGVRPDYCIVGEPTSVARLGDMAKNGRRGTLSGRLVVKGVQGHVAYPHLARNPVHELAPVLARLVATEWDRGHPNFPPTTWQVSNLHAGTGGLNVIPGEVVIDFNFRYSPASTPQVLQERVQQLLDHQAVPYELTWHLGGEPFFTQPGRLSEVVTNAVYQETGLVPELSTTGGTSDARFIRRICEQVLEFGPPNASIHKVDEYIEVGDLGPLSRIYRRALDALLC